MNDFNSTNSPKIHWISHTAIFGALVALAFIATGGVFGRTMVEKLITEMVMPLGVLWLLLIAISYGTLVSRQRFMALLTMTSLVLLTVLGNQYVANALTHSLEQPYLEQSPVLPQDIDTIVLLGGGAISDIQGDSQLSFSGDRVAAAARIYHAGVDDGVAPRIICTGIQVYRSDPADLDPKDESKNCLVALGVAEENISTLPGANTYEEMQHLKEWIDAQKTARRLGILTSAWHLPRAMRLAKARGIEAVPIPSDYRTQFLAPSVGMVVPTTTSLFISTAAVKEYLAGLVKR
jgi:uncharacterized SAM-binding protein YcdF (DUF218 family)